MDQAITCAEQLASQHPDFAIESNWQGGVAPAVARIWEMKQVLDESDAARRGIREGDQLLSFAGRAVTSTNQYKNILGIYPKEWRVPLTFRRNNTER